MEIWAVWKPELKDVSFRFYVGWWYLEDENLFFNENIDVNGMANVSIKNQTRFVQHRSTMFIVSTHSQNTVLR